ncbi:MAG TPA: hypothetical protein VFP34_08400 [Microlunatus sp.]|nr:hypothetical protein [Microlunatus sp.]
MIVVSWIAALVSCLGYGSASVLQSVGARRVATATGVGGVAAILVQAPYLLGLGLDGIAFLANVIALRELPLFLVQTVLSASIGVTAVLAFLRGAPFARRDWASLGVLAIGLVFLGVSATPEAATGLSLVADWIILGSAVVPLAVLLAGLRLPERPSGLTLAAASGLGFTGVAVASRGLSVDRIGLGLLAEPLLWAVVVHGAIAMAAFALALQRGAVTVVNAITFVIEMIVPSAVGIWLLGDHVRPGFEAYAVIGFLLAVAGTISLTRFAD